MNIRNVISVPDEYV
ncbi:DUF2689 domain-containing protein, partial [Salmonella enterica subsp. enterica serovar Typhimurium]